MGTTKFIITNVKKDKVYKGAYQRIFTILNRERIFTEVYETDESVGFVDGTYYLEVSTTLDLNEEEEILKIKNVKLND